MKNKNIFRSILCLMLAAVMLFTVSGCKKGEETKDSMKDYITVESFEKEYKTTDGDVAYKVSYRYPHVDDSEIIEFSTFNEIIQSHYSESASSAATIIANKAFKKGSPWVMKSDYKETLLTEDYYSVVFENRQTTSKGRESVTYTPVVYSFATCERVGLSDFSALGTDTEQYLKPGLIQLIMPQIQKQIENMPDYNAIDAAFDDYSFTLTKDGITIYLDTAILSQYGKIDNAFSLTEKELDGILKLPEQ